MATTKKETSRRLTAYIAPPEQLSIKIDEFTIIHYGWKSGETTDKILAQIMCYNNKMMVSRLSFYDRDHIPLPEIERFSGSPNGYIIRINYAIDRINEIMHSLQSSLNVFISVSTQMGFGSIDSEQSTGILIPKK